MLVQLSVGKIQAVFGTELIRQSGTGGAIPPAVIAFSGDRHRNIYFNAMNIIDRIPVQAFLAVIGGAGLGFLICIAAQKQLNKMAVQDCINQPDTHRLVTMRSFIGDAKYCMHTRYLAN